MNDPPGLTAFGRDVIRTCNELGMADAAKIMGENVVRVLASA